MEFELTLVDTLIQTSQRNVCMYYVAAILPVVLLIKITDENIPSLILIPVVLNSRLFYSSHLDFNVSMI